MKKLKTTDLKRIKDASDQLSLTSEKKRNLFLLNLAKSLEEKRPEIVLANKQDVEGAKKAGLSDVLTERLRLDETGIGKIVQRVLAVKKLESGLGRIVEKSVAANGLLLKKVSVPLGVIFVIYEARPEVTVDVAALCIKSGNAVILKGGSEAIKTNKELYACIQRALKRSELSEEIVSLITERGAVADLLKRHGYIDLVVARGSYRLVNWILRSSIVPVLAHAAGGARIYVDKSADLEMTRKVVLDAKTNKPATCNSLDTLIIHQEIAPTLVRLLVRELKKGDVEIVGDEIARKYAEVSPASTKDWDTEFLGRKISIKVVGSPSEAIKFISKHTKGHSEGIMATNEEVINLFTKAIDAAAVFVNCSTRLHDGYIFGLGAEMGIATGKLHARGPVGLKELTTYKWIVLGRGQVRV